MSCFLLPKTFCKELENILASFWWRNSKEKRGIHWCSWTELCKLKNFGGLGFRDLAKFNVALLAKQGWRLVTSPSSLIGRLFWAKYFPSSDFMKARLGSNPSLIWRSVWSARGLLKKRIRWKVGCGRMVSVWNDYWLPGPVPKKVSSLQTLDVQWVADLIDEASGGWMTDLVMTTFSSSEALEILSISLPMGAQPDTKVWYGEHSGIYSVRSGYRLLMHSDLSPSQESTLLRKIWQSNCPTK
ncbi:hypothetical protein like AT4G29090 [Hibiscus trionum]|uniref:Reverse transcriptase zinc-binding domain-containing protein n=1 Tax=Hibiscus trionum TaxID=183268 RepID=A0A9W7I9P5_HIBTR|nr:hypothetical protein like AT4G29090 [Hibiscus trionum]